MKGLGNETRTLHYFSIPYLLPNPLGSSSIFGFHFQHLQGFFKILTQFVPKIHCVTCLVVHLIGDIDHLKNSVGNIEELLRIVNEGKETILRF